MPELMCNKCWRKGKWKTDHVEMEHRGTLWYIITILFIALALISMYYKQVSISIILIIYAYFIIIITTKPKVKG
jgi:hypothetical protein